MYEPFGLINLEAMACERAGGGQRDRRDPGDRRRRRDGVPGPVRAGATPSARRATRPRFAADLAGRVNGCWPTSPKRAASAWRGAGAVVEHFSWKTIAEQTVALYTGLLEAGLLR